MTQRLTMKDMDMTTCCGHCNVGKADRTVRLVLGLVAVIVGVAMYSRWGWLISAIIGVVGAVLIVTALVRWCPLYVPLKLSTQSKSECTSESEPS